MVLLIQNRNSNLLGKTIKSLSGIEAPCTKPASNAAKPGCIKKTRKAAIKIQKLLSPDIF